MRKIKSEEFDCVYEILEESFPADERRDYDGQKKLFEDKRYSVYTAGEKEICGFISLWEFDTFMFIEHFAVSKEFRNNGVGASLLNDLCKKTQKQLILEVELPENDTAKRRIAFYGRHGFLQNNFSYEQPAYSQQKQSVPLLIMSYGDKITQDRFNEIKRCLYKEVYKKLY